MLTRRAFLGGASLSAAWAKGLRAARYDLVIKGGRVIDPAGHVDRVADVAIRGERISAVPRPMRPMSSTRGGSWWCPA
ncbi:MAG: hypothetical protein DMF97_12195 [Acidobacteria bacterium]|nr:MAG: hypothetical protein DMF97_12195 [Acidobacteriota bacterium]